MSQEENLEDFFPDVQEDKDNEEDQHHQQPQDPPIGALKIPSKADLPGELINLILFHVHLAFVPRPCLDPFLAVTPSSSVVAHHPSEIAHQIYSKLCLIDRAWYIAVRPYLWSIVKIGRPTSFEKLLWTIGTSDDGVQVARASRHELSMSPPNSRGTSPAGTERRGRRDVEAVDQRGGRQTSPQYHRPPNQHRSGSLSRVLLSNSASSYYRNQSMSPSRASRADYPPSQSFPSHTLDEALETSLPWEPSNPGLLISYLSFSRFRTHGMRRTVRESSQQRFVTSARLLKMLRGTRAPGRLLKNPNRIAVANDGDDNDDEDEDSDYDEYDDNDYRNVRGRLVALGLTEYMDGALVDEVLEEILFRGGVDIEYIKVEEKGRYNQDKNSDGNVSSLLSSLDRVCKRHGTRAALTARPIVALDLCGCVSSRFIQGLKDIVATHRIGGASSDVISSELVEKLNLGQDQEEEQGQGQRQEQEQEQKKKDTQKQDKKLIKYRTLFPHLRRLGLSHTLIAPELLSTFVSSFPNLTHLDLTNTRASPLLLETLGKTEGMRLECLSLARCRGLTSESIRDFLTGAYSRSKDPKRSGVCDSLKDLSLYGDRASLSPVFVEDLMVILREAPCFTSGQLRSLDLATLPLNDIILNENLCNIPNLVDLGLSNCPALSFEGVMRFLSSHGRRIQVIDLANSCSARHRDNIKQGMIYLHSQLLTPLNAIYSFNEPNNRLCDVRVIELEETLLDAIQGGAKNWKVVWGRGRRGWYVDTQSVSKEFNDDIATVPKENQETESGINRLDSRDAQYVALSKLANANGNVSSDIGWHPHKMEVLFGLGMLGREEGLYGFHAYA